MTNATPAATKGTATSMRVLGGAFAVAVVVAGAIAGWVWHAMVSLPTFLTSDDGSAQITERAQGQVFATDAVFVIIGMIAGGALGFAAWRFFRGLGWPVAVIAVAGGLLAGVVCWLVGVAQGPRDFAARVAAAVPGEKVPIDFTLHTTSALLVWALGAIVPVMLYANLSREDETVRRSGSRPGEIGEIGVEKDREVVGSKLN